jgi:quinol monooxygenase YgiN
MILVVGEARFGPGEIERMRDGFGRWFEEARRRSGCVSYSFSVDLADPDLLHVVECWKDEAAIDEHMKDMGQLMEVLAGADMRALSVKAYRAEYVKTLMGE